MKIKICIKKLFCYFHKLKLSYTNLKIFNLNRDKKRYLNKWKEEL